MKEKKEDQLNMGGKKRDYPQSVEKTIVRGIILVALLLTFSSSLSGIVQHSITVLTYYKNEVRHDVNHLRIIMSDDDLRWLYHETMRIYESCADKYDEETAFTEEYRDLYKEVVEDERYKRCREFLTQARESDGLQNISLIFNDNERKRTVFVVDGDVEKYKYYPGQWVSDIAGDLTPPQMMDAVSDSKWLVDVTFGNKSGWTATDCVRLTLEDGETLGYVDAEVYLTNLEREALGLIIMAIPTNLLVVAFILAFADGEIQKLLIKPISKISNAAGKYVHLKTDEIIRGESVFSEVSLSRKDELLELLETLQLLEKTVSTSMSRIREMSVEQERVNAELSVAYDIQQGLLPHEPEIFAGHKEFNVYGWMEPAREIGGDFYDLFMVDDEHLVFLIADVSDKAVGAALFMAISKSMIQLRMSMGGSPGEVLSDVSERLLMTSEETMFVTVWMGVLDICTGHVVACNAGHDYPAYYGGMKDASRGFVIEKEKHGSPVAFWQGMQFPEIEFDMAPGNRIFLYTDGVTEARGISEEQFGEDRLVDVLNKSLGEDGETVCENVRRSIKEFTGDAEQFDDMTMLFLEWRGPSGEKEASADENAAPSEKA